jgi:SAM-dependent methyltransferase
VSSEELREYWDERARRFASNGGGHRAVCSYGMPGFYNAAIDLAQQLALRPWIRVPPGTEVLDVGCGVGRWSRRLARRGARVTGVDHSVAMIDEARRRAAGEPLRGSCSFLAADLSVLELDRRFPLVLGVTVLQHVVDPERLRAALARLAEHLAPEGRLVLLEAAPAARGRVAETPQLRLRSERGYLDAFRAEGLELCALTGVDPLPLKIRFLPSYARLPRAAGLPLLGLLTALSLPAEVVLGRAWASASWHKVFVLERGGGRA